MSSGVKNNANERKLFMMIIKSRVLTFIIKLIMLCTISSIALYSAMLITGGGHGNYLLLLLILGPLNLLLPVMQFLPYVLMACGILQGGEDDVYAQILPYIIMMSGTVCLYVVYALYIKISKSKNAFLKILTLHAVSIIMALQVYMEYGFDLLNKEDGVTIGVASFILPVLIFGILASIQRANNKERDSASQSR